MPTLNDFELDQFDARDNFAALYPRDVRSTLQPTSTQRTTLIVAGIYIIAIAILWYVLCPFRLTTICMLLEKEPYNDILFAFVFGLGMYHFLVG